eukprot:4478153-Pyramimonas_sp.AAC.2
MAHWRNLLFDCDQAAQGPSRDSQGVSFVGPSRDMSSARAPAAPPGIRSWPRDKSQGRATAQAGPRRRPKSARQDFRFGIF